MVFRIRKTAFRITFCRVHATEAKVEVTSLMQVRCIDCSCQVLQVCFWFPELRPLVGSPDSGKALQGLL